MTAQRDGTRQLLVRGMTWEADGVLGLELCDPGGLPLPDWQPGAHLDVTLAGSLNRQFSLCGDPADRYTYRLGILRERDSRGGTQFVHERLRPGDRVVVSPPRNNFALVPAPRYLFIAGGIGVTPILPMVRAADAGGVPWRLLYGGRSRAGMAFLADLARYGDRVSVAPQDETGLLDLDSALSTPDPDTAVYCCGPEPLLVAVQERCQAYGWAEGALHVERFHARPQPDRDPGQELGFDVVCQRSGLTVRVGPQVTILNALEDAGVVVDSSCQEGICGTCETRVLDGVPEHRDSLLTESERQAGKTMMVCCSRSRTARLVLDL